METPTWATVGKLNPSVTEELRKERKVVLELPVIFFYFFEKAL
jgi:hypothetical protein